MPLILIVDDEKDMRAALSNALKHEGYTVIDAGDGASALEIIKREPIELVLLDIRMPNMDGIEVLEKIRQEYSSLPVVMVTGYGSIESAVQSIKKGAFDYVLKPFDLTKLVTVMEKAMQISTIEKGEKLLDRQVASNLGLKKKARKTEKYRKLKRGLIFKLSFLIFCIVLSIFISYFVIKEYGWDRKIYYISSEHPSAITFNSQDIFISDWVKEEIYQYQKKSALDLLKTFSCAGKHITGLAFARNCIFSCDGWEGKIYKHKMDDNLSIEQTYSSPAKNPSCLFWDGKYLYSGDSAANIIYKHDAGKDLQVVASYPVNTKRLIGIYVEGTSIWAADGAAKKIYKYAIVSGKPVLSKSYSLEDKEKSISAFAVVNRKFSKEIWILSEESSEIHIYNLWHLK